MSRIAAFLLAGLALPSLSGGLPLVDPAQDRALRDELIAAQRWAEALEPARRVAAHEAATRRGSAEHGQAVYLVASICRRLGQLEEGVQAARQAADILKALPEPDPTLTSEAYREWGLMAVAARQLEEAETAFRGALEWRRKVQPQDVAGLARVLNALGDVQRSRGKTQEARANFEEALTVLPTQPSVPRGAVLNNIAACLMDERRFADAIPVLEQALAVFQALPNQVANLIRVQTSLGSCLQIGGRFFEAERAFGAALALGRESQLQPVAFSELESNYGLSLRDLGRWSEAEGLFRNAIQRLGDQPQRQDLLGAYRSNLGDTLALLGRNDDARAEYLAALAAYGNVFQKEDRIIATVRNNLGLLDLAAGNLKEASENLSEALRIYGLTLPEGDALMLSTRASLAQTQASLGDAAAARQNFEMALRLSRETLGQSHPDTAGIESGFARFLADQGDARRALELQSRALETFRSNLEPNHPSVLNALSLMASTQLAVGQPEAAKKAFGELARGRVAYLASQSALLTDASRFAVAQSFGDEQTSIGLMAVSNAEQSFEWLTNLKGIATNVRLRTQPLLRQLASDEQLAPLFDDYLAAQRALEEASTAPMAGTTFEERAASVRAAREAVEQSERQLNQAIQEKKLGAPVEYLSLDQIRRQLGSRTLVQYLRVGERFAALVYRGGDVSFVPMAPAGEINDARRAFQDKFVGKLPMNAEARRLHQLLIEPLRLSSADLSSLVIVPEGPLATVPFDALRDTQGRWLVETANISIASSVREFLSVGAPNTSPEIVVFANPAFDLKLTNEGEASDRAGQTGGWSPLPGTEKEALALRRLFPNARLIKGQGATEQALYAVRSPGVLHLATHGFFYVAPARKLSERQRELLAADRRVQRSIQAAQDPLVRSFLVMAGANQAEELAADGKSGNGYATALEIATMDLRGTRLVMLSACQTGRGDVQGSEGVLGLRSAFLSAGARTVIATLENVPDLATAKLVPAFYEEARKSTPYVQSLTRAKRQLLKDEATRHPSNWASFVLVGGR